MGGDPLGRYAAPKQSGADAGNPVRKRPGRVGCHKVQSSAGGQVKNGRFCPARTGALLLVPLSPAASVSNINLPARA